MLQSDISDLVSRNLPSAVGSKAQATMASALHDGDGTADLIVRSPQREELMVTRSVEFPVYTDAELVSSLSTSKLDVSARNRLVRATISTMSSVCMGLPEPRYPSREDIMQMAKALVQRYPVLKDPSDINPRKPWEGLYKQLTRRQANVKPVKSPQGKMPNRRKKLQFADTVNTNTETRTVCVPLQSVIVTDPQLEEDTTVNQQDTSDDADDDNPTLMASYYEKLKETLKAKKPNVKVVRQLLDLEFIARRRFVESLDCAAGNTRVTKTMEAYSCFSEAVHLSDEVARYISPKDDNFTAECLERFHSLVDPLFMYALQNNVVPPKCYTPEEKVELVYSNLTEILSKGRKRGRMIKHINDKRDVNTTKKSGEPTIVVTTNDLLVVAEGMSFGVFPREAWWEVIQTVMGLYYTFRLQYSMASATALLFIQTHILGDNIHSSDMSPEYKQAINKFEHFMKT